MHKNLLKIIPQDMVFGVNSKKKRGEGENCEEFVLCVLVLLQIEHILAPHHTAVVKDFLIAIKKRQVLIM